MIKYYFSIFILILCLFTVQCTISDSNNDLANLTSLESRSSNPFNSNLTDNQLKIIKFLGDNKDFQEIVLNDIAFEKIVISPILLGDNLKSINALKGNHVESKKFLDSKLKFDYVKTTSKFVKGKQRRLEKIEKEAIKYFSPNFNKEEYDKTLIEALMRLRVVLTNKKYKK